MYELIQVSENTFYMDCPSKVGFFKTSESEVVLIDSGSDKDAGKKVKRILDEKKWKLKAIYNTHSHADHIGGNQYLQSQTGCKVYARGIECCFTAYPVLEPLMLYGGNPLKELETKFLMAKESAAEPLTDDVLPEGLEIIELPGHSYDMIGFRTSDDVVFLADCVSSEETLDKYQIGFLYDVKKHLETLEKVKEIKAKCFIPSHAPTCEDISPLAQLNIDKTKKIAERIAELLLMPRTYDDLLADVFDSFGLTMTLQQNVLVGSTVKSYLSYLKDEGIVDFFFKNNRMIWRRISGTEFFRGDIPETAFSRGDISETEPSDHRKEMPEMKMTCEEWGWGIAKLMNVEHKED